MSVTEIVAKLQRENNELRAELAAFRCAAEHVTEDGNTRRSFTASEGWAMVHKDRLLDLEIIEERLNNLLKGL